MARVRVSYAVALRTAKAWGREAKIGLGLEGDIARMLSARASAISWRIRGIPSEYLRDDISSRDEAPR